MLKMGKIGSAKDGVSKALLEEFSLLLQDRTFVDYFNIFLCLPVFGQHVFYNFVESEFEFEPPIKQRRDLFLDKREVLLWLCKERFSLFKSTALSSEYSLCTKLKTSNLTNLGIKNSGETTPGEDSSTLVRNVMGTVLGMLMFRESLRGSCGETVYRCWRDIEAWRHLGDAVRRMYWKHVIKNKYIKQGGSSELKGRLKVLVFQGVLNFDLIPEEAVQQRIWQGLEAFGAIKEVESDDALLQLQVVLLDAMRRYWVPRFFLHFQKTVSEETIEKLSTPVPWDLGRLNQERRMRCRFMFPIIYQSTSGTPTEVIVSQSNREVCSPEYLNLGSSEDARSPFEDDVSPTSLFNLWSGPSEEHATEGFSPGAVSSGPSLASTSPNLYGNERIQSRITSSKFARSPIPIVLLSYLGGKKRTVLGKFPSTSNRVSWSLASDALAGGPFRTFLFERGFTTDLSYLSFWTDVRNYLDTDERAVDGYGFHLKRMLANKFMETYLSQSGEGSNLFSESLKTSMFNALGQANDVSLLCMAQDIILENLWEPLKLYIQDERRRFLKQVRGYSYKKKLLKQRIEQQDFKSPLTTPVPSNLVEPLYFFQCTTVGRVTASDPSTPVYHSVPPLPSVSESSAPSAYHVSITEEQIWKAMELAVLCSEYGVSMMVPQYPPKPEQLIDVLYGDYGSLHLSRVPAVRIDWIRNLLFPPKINIETIKVSRRVILEEIDISGMLKRGESARSANRNRLLLRRHGMIIERPSKPKCFLEVLQIPGHYDFFKRFMTANRATMPLFFWKAVEDAKNLSNLQQRAVRVNQILRKFFGKQAKYGAVLDCHEDIIRQIPNMEKLTVGILVCAQAAVYRSMERKWFPMYLETYPPEAESPPTSRTTVIQPRTVTPEITEFVIKVKTKSKKKAPEMMRKTNELWRSFARSLVQFWRAMKDATETQLLDMYLKCEIEKEQQAIRPGAAQDTTIEKNIMMSTIATNVHQTRLVVRNRLVTLNKLPADLQFWLEVQKFIELVDGSKLGPESVLLQEKAKSIVNCYLNSEFPPKIQINIPTDLATNIAFMLSQNGPTRGMFHDALFMLFPPLNHFWKRYTAEWKIAGDVPDSYLDFIEKYLLFRVNDTPHANVNVKDYTNLKTDDIKAVSHYMFDDSMVRIHFSISEGVTIIYPHPKTHDRGVTKRSMFSKSPGSQSPQKIKESKSLLAPKDKKDTRLAAADKTVRTKEEHTKDGEKPTKDMKKKSKIVVKDPNEPLHLPSETNVLSPRKDSLIASPKQLIDRAQRLNRLVEALNSEREIRVQSLNKRFNQRMNFDDVVSAALKKISNSAAMFS